MNDTPATPKLSEEDAKKIVSASVMKAFQTKPPTIAVVGLSGTGKSSTLNELFGQHLPVSHSIRGTIAFTRIELHAKPRDAYFGPLPFVFMDAPGLGEDLDRDGGYLDEYDKYLPECDVILWVLAARNRALSQDQAYLSRFSQYKEKIILGINQADIVHPNSWDQRTNLPSTDQIREIDDIMRDRVERMSKIAGCKIPAVVYSAAQRWRLLELLNLILNACQSERRFMFDMLSHVSPNDFLPTRLNQHDKVKVLKELKRREKSPVDDFGLGGLFGKFRGR
jgi:predicted GTPase